MFRSDESRTAMPSHLLREVRLDPWAESETAALFVALEAIHYLGAPDPRQRLLGQVAKLGEQTVGMLGWTHAARTLRARERVVGWDAGSGPGPLDGGSKGISYRL